jgi:hypothetical protein
MSIGWDHQLGFDQLTNGHPFRASVWSISLDDEFWVVRGPRSASIHDGQFTIDRPNTTLNMCYQSQVLVRLQGSPDNVISGCWRRQAFLPKNGTSKHLCWESLKDIAGYPCSQPGIVNPLAAIPAKRNDIVVHFARRSACEWKCSWIQVHTTTSSGNSPCCTLSVLIRYGKQTLTI